MSDTKETEGYTTVELTLDNDEVIECGYAGGADTGDDR